MLVIIFSNTEVDAGLSFQTYAIANNTVDNAVELNPPVSATQPSPPLLPLQDPQDQHGPPQDLPPPRAIRCLALETVEMQQASDSLELRLPTRSPKRSENLVGEEAQDPASPVVYCSQYRMEEYEWQIGPLPGNEKVGEAWPRRQRTGPTGLQLCRLPPPRARINTSQTQNWRTAGAADDCHRLCSLRTDACLRTQDHDGGPGLPLCYYATGLQEGGPHDFYVCFDKRDIVWACRIRFHNERDRYYMEQPRRCCSECTCWPRAGNGDW
jgi:hypothetical protein